MADVTSSGQVAVMAKCSRPSQGVTSCVVHTFRVLCLIHRRPVTAVSFHSVFQPVSLDDAHGSLVIMVGTSPGSLWTSPVLRRQGQPHMHSRSHSTCTQTFASSSSPAREKPGHFHRKVGLSQTHARSLFPFTVCLQ